MRKYRQVNTDGSAHRIFEGQLRVCSSDDKKNYKVKLMLLNERVNRNNWQYTRVAEHAREAENIPLLYSVIDGKIGNSHDFTIVTILGFIALFNTSSVSSDNFRSNPSLFIL